MSSEYRSSTVPSSRTARSALLLVALRGRYSTPGTLYSAREATWLGLGLGLRLGLGLELGLG